MGALATFSLIYLFITLSRLSEKFGSVLKMSPLYRWFRVAELFAAVAAVAHLMQATTFLADPDTVATGRDLSQATSPAFTVLFHHLPLAVAVTIALAITWKYWGWLITDRNR